uniref:Recombination activating protein 2 n=1 Tax=Ditylenchus dipsaci TaxID=166011 RepID=A0A915ED20_9BILA
MIIASKYQAKDGGLALSLDGWKKKVVRIHENGPHQEVFNCSLDDLIIIGSSSHMIELTDKRIGNQVKKMVEFESSFDKKLFEQQCESICESSTGKTVVCSDIGDDGSKTLLFGCRAHPDSFLDEDTASTTALVFKTQDDFNLVEFMSMGSKELFMQQCFPEQFEVHSSGLVSVRGALPMQSGFSFSGVRSDGSRRFECRKLVQNSGRDIYGLKTSTTLTTPFLQ